MAPCRQLLMWSVPSIAVLLGIFWFRKKREYAKSDPGGRERLKSLKEELAEALNAEAEAMRVSPLGKTDRSIIKSAPIDIIPNGSGSQRSSPLHLTDEEVDIEIEKILRKKSLEKEKKMSFGAGAHSLVANSCKMEGSFVVNETPNILSSHKAENAFNKNDIDACSIKTIEDDAKLVISEDSITDECEAEYSQQNSTKLDTVESEVNTTEDSTVADTEELNMNNNVEPSDSNDSENRFSAQTRRISERDSANHSPVDPMLASPSMCHFSDNHSEVILLIYYSTCLSALLL